jgi:tyrosyl-tRNA synthetase
MAENFLQNLKNRGLVEQFSHPEKTETVINNEKHTFYIGFDPTADSLHIGSLVPLILLKNLVKNGHEAICLIGDGTAIVGDPSGKTEMRKMLEKDGINKNAKLIEKQIKKLIPEIKIFVHNFDWLSKINYLDFLREFGPIFKVNEMIKAETYKTRLEKNESLTFLEFNYQLLQAYDFLYLFKKYHCDVQIGGGDQWSNMLAGIELIRRKCDSESYVVTVPLLVNSSGKKMGKTENGTAWLDKDKTSAYDFYQFWMNVEDQDVLRFLKIFTDIDLEEIEKMDLTSYEKIKEAKEILAVKITTFVHGEKEAKSAMEATKKLFTDNESDLDSETSDSVPTIEIKLNQLKENANMADLLVKLGLVASKTQARQLLLGGGVYINKEKVDQKYSLENLYNENTSFLIRIGKKKYFRIKVTD